MSLPNLLTSRNPDAYADCAICRFDGQPGYSTETAGIASSIIQPFRSFVFISKLRIVCIKGILIKIHISDAFDKSRLPCYLQSSLHCYVTLHGVNSVIPMQCTKSSNLLSAHRTIAIKSGQATILLRIYIPQNILTPGVTVIRIQLKKYGARSTEHRVTLLAIRPWSSLMD